MPLLLPAILISAALCGVCVGLLLHEKLIGRIAYFRTRERIRRIFVHTTTSNRQPTSVHQQHISFPGNLCLAMAPSAPKELAKIRKKLDLAGFRQEKHIGYYYCLKYCGVMAAAIVGLYLWRTGVISAAFIIIFSIPFLVLPDILLTILTRNRLQKVILGLPDFIDMCNLNMTAGLGWLNSVKKVISQLKEIHPEICLEFTLFFDQIQTGMDRIEAFSRLASRNPTPEMQSLVTILIQNERMGSSISGSLADFSQRIYLMRQQTIEEKAGKLSAKMIFIIMPFLFFPYMMILFSEHFVVLWRTLGL